MSVCARFHPTSIATEEQIALEMHHRHWLVGTIICKLRIVRQPLKVFLRAQPLFQGVTLATRERTLTSTSNCGDLSSPPRESRVSIRVQEPGVLFVLNPRDELR